jgi:hypothetical protein
MVRVPGAGHGIAARPSNLIAKVANVLAWFERYRTDKKKDETTKEEGADTEKGKPQDTGEGKK